MAYPPKRSHQTGSRSPRAVIPFLQVNVSGPGCHLIVGYGVVRPCDTKKDQSAIRQVKLSSVQRLSPCECLLAIARNVLKTPRIRKGPCRFESGSGQHQDSLSSPRRPQFDSAQRLCSSTEKAKLEEELRLGSVRICSWKLFVLVPSGLAFLTNLRKQVDPRRSKP
jgi:hypothetical protein